jgi:hypothetical protein
MPMKVFGRRSLILMFALVLGAGAFWATALLADKPERLTLPVAGQKAACPEETLSTSTAKDHDGTDWPHSAHDAVFTGLGTFQEEQVKETDPIMVEFGEPYRTSSGQKVVPFKVLSIGGRAFAEGVGETRFWLDPSRPVISAIWEKTPGTEFPAIQEMRFHFFYTVEAMPGKVFRSINPSVMRSDNVRAFPPPPGTIYTLARVVNLEDINEPGVIVGKLLTNRVVVPDREGRQRPGSRD